MNEAILYQELLSGLNLLKETYIKLQNDLDVLQHWGKPQLEALYTTKIGIWLVKRLQAQLRIKALQLKIEKLTSCQNLELPIDLTQIELEVALLMASAEEQIMMDTATIASAKKLLNNIQSPERSSELRKLYRELAKQLHPDVNESLTPELIQLWHLVQSSYDEGDLEKLKALKIVYEKELILYARDGHSITAEKITLKIAVLKEGIKLLLDKLLDIQQGFPFTMEGRIKDEHWIASETALLKEELNKLSTYEEELTVQYHQMISLI